MRIPRTLPRPRIDTVMRARGPLYSVTTPSGLILADDRVVGLREPDVAVWARDDASDSAAADSAAVARDRAARRDLRERGGSIVASWSLRGEPDVAVSAVRDHVDPPRRHVGVARDVTVAGDGS